MGHHFTTSDLLSRVDSALEDYERTTRAWAPGGESSKALRRELELEEEDRLRASLARAREELSRPVSEEELRRMRELEEGRRAGTLSREEEEELSVLHVREEGTALRGMLRASMVGAALAVVGGILSALPFLHALS